MRKKKLCACLLTICMIVSTGTEVKAANIAPKKDVAQKSGIEEMIKAQSEEDIPTESANPTESPMPTESANPTESPMPTESATPTELPMPTESAAPTVSPVPSVTPEPTETPKPVDISILYIDESFTLAQKQTRKLLFETDIEMEEDMLKWTSSDTEVATIDQNGVVKAKAVGKAKITLESVDGAGSASVTVKVTDRKKGTQYSESDLDIVSIASAKYTYEAMEKDIEELVELYGDRLEMTSLGTTYDNRQIYALILGNPDAEKTVMVQSAIHAREYMVSMLTMRQVELYCKNYYNGTYDGKYFSELFDEVAFYIVPMANPDGVTISQFGVDKIKSKDMKEDLLRMRNQYGGSSNSYFTRWKANGRGVDLNRNFDANWSIVQNGKSYRNSELYKGTKPVSEKESKALVDLFNKINPEASISYHAMGRILYWNYGQTGELLKTSKQLRDTVNSLLNYSLVQGFSKTQCAGFSDWVSIKKKTPALTVEIGYVNCPLPLSQFSSVWSKNKLVMAATAELYQ